MTQLLLLSSQVRHGWVSKNLTGKLKAPKMHISSALKPVSFKKISHKKRICKMHKEVQYCTCVKEKHQNGGLHYHVTLKLPGPKHCKSLKESISLKEWIVVNFSGNSDNYYSAYRYISKDDDSVHHSEHHPNLDEVASSRRKSSTHTYREAGKSYAQENLTDASQKQK